MIVPVKRQAERYFNSSNKDLLFHSFHFIPFHSIPGFTSTPLLRLKASLLHMQGVIITLHHCY